MESAETKELMRRYLDEFWGARDESALDRYVHPEVVLHDHVDESGARDVQGFAPLVSALALVSGGFPDYRFEYTALVAAGDTVVVPFTITGTHTGELFGTPPTYRHAALAALTMTRWRDGKMVEGWQATDMVGLLRQLDVLPPAIVPAPLRWAAGLRGRREARRRRAAAGAAAGGD